MVRFFITFLFQILGVRRHNNFIRCRFCLSFFIDDSVLNLKPIALDYDVYLIYWIKSLVPLIDDGVMASFVRENSWVNPYLSDIEFKSRVPLSLVTSSFILKLFRGLFDFIFNGRFGEYVDNKLKKLQLSRVNRKILFVEDPSGIIANDHILKFHNVDMRRSYRSLWLDKYSKDQLITSDPKQLLEIKNAQQAQTPQG